MKRALPWLIGVGCLGVAAAVLWRNPAQREVTATAETNPTPAQTSPAPSAPTQPEAPQAAAGEEKIAYTFPDDAKMQQFLQLWQQRQASVLRITVLQSYLSEEQGRLNTLNQQLSADYTMDVAKSYKLDDQQRVLIEIPTPPAQGAPLSPPAPAGQ